MQFTKWLDSIQRIRAIFYLLAILLLFFFSWSIGKSIIFKTNELHEFYQLLKNNSFSLKILNNPQFWNHSIGICLKILIEIIITSFLMYAVLVSLNYKTSFKLVIKIVVLAQLVFLLQYWVEFTFIIFSENRDNTDFLKEFSLLSVHDFLRRLHIKYPLFLKYAFQILGLFELVYWFVLSYLLLIILKITFIKAFLIVLLGYILPLFIWLLFISWNSL